MLRQVTQVVAGESGAEVFTRDRDPQLVAEAMPFALKTYETLLAADPRNPDLCLSTGRAFVQYANAFVEAGAERIEDSDFEKAREEKARAAGLYWRGRDYLLQGLDLRYDSFLRRLREDSDALMSQVERRDVPMLFWMAAGWAGGINLQPSDMDRVADLPLVEAVMRKVLELDEGFDHGVVHEFFIAFEGGRSETMGGNARAAREHFQRAVELTGGRKVSPYVSLAATVAVNAQDAAEFRELLQAALAVKPDEVPEWTLMNVLSQQKATRLLQQGPELFLDWGEE